MRVVLETVDKIREPVAGHWVYIGNAFEKYMVYTGHKLRAHMVYTGTRTGVHWDGMMVHTGIHPRPGCGVDWDTND